MLMPCELHLRPRWGQPPKDRERPRVTLLRASRGEQKSETVLGVWALNGEPCRAAKESQSLQLRTEA
jgi:hypothetical protein